MLDRRTLHGSSTGAYSPVAAGAEFTDEMKGQADDATLLRGRFSDAARARDAFDALMGAPAELDVAFYGSNHEYTVLVAAKSDRAGGRAARVLREHGAIIEEQSLLRWRSKVRNRLVHGAGADDAMSGGVDEPLASWAATLLVAALERRLVEPVDILAILIASGRRGRRTDAAPANGADVLSARDRRRRLREADAELHDASERLEAALRARHPELFDRRGRLRTAAWARRVAERTGGKKSLSGDDLSKLEEAADAKAARSAHAP